MKKLTAFLLLLLAPSLAFAQKRSEIFVNYDLDAVVAIFCDTTTFSTSPPEGMATCATGNDASDGFIDSVGEDFAGVMVIVDQIVLLSGNIDVQIFGTVKDNTSPYLIGSVLDITAAGVSWVPITNGPFHKIAVSIVIDGADDASDAGGAAEDISIFYYSARRLTR